ncbi:hypothetical protein TWF718_011344 [Orbilia javanica]|uniref:Mid2 domain-containing protein n=1 Tax=Orbilia javanica TaxID=47235 RepID=A0AAN8NNS6_9PEZI
MRLVPAPAFSLLVLYASSNIPATFALNISSPSINDLNSLSYNFPTLQQAKLPKRQDDNSTDVCNQAFPGRYSEICQPSSISNTLCCALKASFPMRPVPDVSQFLATASVAPSTNHASLTSPAPAGPLIVSSAIQTHAVQTRFFFALILFLPLEFTRCATNFNQTLELVRCEIRAESIPEVVSGTTRPVSGSARSTTTTAPASSSQTFTDPSVTGSDISTATLGPSTGTSETSPLSGGAIAGIVVGAILALLIGVGIGWFLFNQRALRFEELRMPPQPPAARFNGQQGHRQFHGAPFTISGSLDGYQPQPQQYKPPEAQELPSRPEAMELQGQTST